MLKLYKNEQKGVFEASSFSRFVTNVDYFHITSSCFENIISQVTIKK